jgi:hypothetical protein
MTHPLIKLVAPARDAETVDVLEDLLIKARRGEVIGFAYVAMQPGGDYYGDVVGVARSTPLLARGIVGALWEELPSFAKRCKP